MATDAEEGQGHDRQGEIATERDVKNHAVLTGTDEGIDHLTEDDVEDGNDFMSCIML